MAILNRLFSYVQRKAEALLPPRRLVVVEGDSLPHDMPMRSIVLARDGTEDWCVGLRCPCGCGRTIELLVIKEAKPRWDYSIDKDGLPSLMPSIWLKSGCKSHFWLKKGRIHWM
ncbi:DUF6527 family protein [Pseudomonas sp. OTU750018]|uniref:DUF6527 family protein n=1 Tax=Pseudomonas sp. OTU750018 TaxID=2709708 RepID=UPI00315D3E1B